MNKAKNIVVIVSDFITVVVNSLTDILVKMSAPVNENYQASINLKAGNFVISDQAKKAGLHHVNTIAEKAFQALMPERIEISKVSRQENLFVVETSAGSVSYEFKRRTMHFKTQEGQFVVTSDGWVYDAKELVEAINDHRTKAARARQANYKAEQAKRKALWETKKVERELKNAEYKAKKEARELVRKSLNEADVTVIDTKFTLKNKKTRNSKNVQVQVGDVKISMHKLSNGELYCKDHFRVAKSTGRPIASVDGKDWHEIDAAVYEAWKQALEDAWAAQRKAKANQEAQAEAVRNNAPEKAKEIARAYQTACQVGDSAEKKRLKKIHSIAQKFGNGQVTVSDFIEALKDVPAKEEKTEATPKVEQVDSSEAEATLLNEAGNKKRGKKRNKSQKSTEEKSLHDKQVMSKDQKKQLAKQARRERNDYGY